ncbi:MAG: MoaD/ThiS family protein [Thermoleophilia bacterium]|nr:MoaD/ThiS family protein [Thermoleophilia bacterium]
MLDCKSMENSGKDKNAVDQSVPVAAPTVEVEFFPRRPGEDNIVVSLQSVRTLGDLLDHLEMPPTAEAVLVNGRYERPQYTLGPGDRITIIRSMPGGG